MNIEPLRVLIQYNSMGPIDVNAAAAQNGFDLINWECVPFYNEMPSITKNDLVVGHIGIVLKALDKLKVDRPDPIDYPGGMENVLNRRVWKSSLNMVMNFPEMWPVFIKPVHHHKLFKGFVVNEYSDFILNSAFGSWSEDVEVWCSDVVEFKTEYRCFVRYSEILDVRHYRGDWKIRPNVDYIEKVVKLYDHKIPLDAYSIDFGVMSDGTTTIVEVNDSYSLGYYGLNHVSYAKMICTRWCQLTDQPDVLGEL